MRDLHLQELEAGLDEIRFSPEDECVLEMIVRRPNTDQREVLEKGCLDLLLGLVGDNSRARGSSRASDGSAHLDMQLTRMNARTISLVAQSRERWKLARDQLFIDMDHSAENLSPGTRLKIGSAVVEVTATPHTGCKKCMARCAALRDSCRGYGQEMRCIK